MVHFGRRQRQGQYILLIIGILAICSYEFIKKTVTIGEFIFNFFFDEWLPAVILLNRLLKGGVFAEGEMQ